MNDFEMIQCLTFELRRMKCPECLVIIDVPPEEGDSPCECDTARSLIARVDRVLWKEGEGALRVKHDPSRQFGKGVKS